MFGRVFIRTLVFIAVVLPVVAQAQPDFKLIPPNDAFPDRISPSHVYARIDLLDRSLDALLEARNIELMKAVLPREVEQDLQPMHVYQAVLICTWRLQQLDDLREIDIKPIPTISADPRVYYPRDVFFIVDMMLNNVRVIGTKVGVDMPADEMSFTDKTPTDVFNRAVRVFVKLNVLCGYEDLQPSEVFAQMVRGVEDVKSMLRQADPAARYRIDKPPTEPNREPGDVFEMCLNIRKQINLMRQALGMEAIPVPEMSVREDIQPFDVFFQSQIIIAELNLLKKPLQTKSSSPLPVPVTGKTPTRVHEQATMILHLLKQVKLPEPESRVE